MSNEWREGYKNWEQSHNVLGIELGHHFKYCNNECRLRSDGDAILVFDYEYGDWIKPAYRTLQLEYVIAHKDDIEEYPLEKWHIETDEPSYIRKLRWKF